MEAVPVSVREQAVNQILSILAAVYSGWTSDLGQAIERAFPPIAPGAARILPTGVSAPAPQSALLMASWSVVLDYDDVMLGGHTGHSSVLAPLALASEGGRSGADWLLAQITANEIAARVNMVCAMGSARGQMATYLHLLGASAARAKIEHLDEEEFSNALSFALSYPAEALFPAFIGSDAKVLCAGLPIRVGMESVDVACSGLTPAADILDDPHGFFSSRSPLPIREFLGGLGQQWHTETNSFKTYPVCGYLCAALDATLDLVLKNNLSADEVATVDVWSSLFTVAMDAHSAPYLNGPKSYISTLTFSTPFTIASAILAREFGPAQLKREWIENPKVWELAARIKTRLDTGLTIKSLTADIPIGAALRRTRRLQAAVFAWGLAAKAYGHWGRWLNPSTFRLMFAISTAAGEERPLNLRSSTKPMGARVEIRCSDGRVLSESVSIPRGFAGSSLSDNGGKTIRQLMREKFDRCAREVVGDEAAAEVGDLIEQLETLSPADVERLIDLACIPVVSVKPRGFEMRHVSTASSSMDP
jgi:2-methylcitrate dehydratase PrpD